MPEPTETAPPPAVADTPAQNPAPVDAASVVADPDGRAAIQRRTLRVLAGAQVLGGASFFVGLAVAALLSRDLSGTASLAGVPVALGVALAALAALPISRWMTRVGRRPGLVLGYLVGSGGAAIVIAAAALDSFPLLLVGIPLAGLANTSNLLSRYAAADLSVPARRGRAISTVLLATTVGALAGPNLVGPGRDLATSMGLPGLSGSFMIAIVAGLLAALVLTMLLRPDPLAVAAGLQPRSGRRERPARRAAALRIRVPHGLLANRPAMTGIAAMVVANLVMVSIMTMTPIHLDDHGHSLELVGLVISLHVTAMFLPSPLTGWLCDRVGRLPVIVGGGLFLVGAGVVGAVASPHAATPVAVALVLLGLGWNFALIGGSTLLTDSIPVAQRPGVQGAADLTMGMVGALGSVAAGPILDAQGFGAICLIGASLAGALLAALLMAPLRARPAA